MVLVNGILTLYITIPLWGYYLFNVEKKFFKIIPILVIIEAVIDNILIARNILGILYISRVVFYILLTVPIFRSKNNKYEKDSIEGNMQKVTKITVVAFIPIMISLVPVSLLVFEISYAASVFWAVFTLLFQIPGLIYCKNRLLKKDASTDKRISSLTKRENEIAAAICNGYKYEEIAEKLNITISTVKTHSYTIYKKLGINNNRELMQIFLESQKKETNSP
ncbi:MAG: helix-turn-helix transcriptional regulator [Treponema sp.]|jgi:DNA-binding CsgD family transcriptional regulator|nr:helix-turn-helix transcriptional regulator [Treponema sp.]